MTLSSAQPYCALVMLWTLRTLQTFHLAAGDGDAGQIVDVAVDVREWAAHALLLGIGRWPRHRRVEIPMTALGPPRPDTRRIPTALSRDDVARHPSPSVTGRPIRLDRPDDTLFNAPPMPPTCSFAFSPALMFDDDTWLAMWCDKALQDDTLLEAGELIGCDVETAEEWLGVIDDILIDDHDWTVRGLVVVSPDARPSRRVIPTQDVTEFDGPQRIARVASAPPSEPSTELWLPDSVEDEEGTLSSS